MSEASPRTAAEGSPGPLRPPAETTGRRKVRELASGTRVGRHIISAVLGRGGAGVVYQAIDSETLHASAVKLLAAQGDEHRRRFLREARVCTALRHPNVVSVSALGEHEGMPYIAMELMTGGSLDSRVRRDGPMPPREAAQAVMEAARGVDAFHRSGVIHRDVKPANLFRTADGTVKVGDLGLARTLEESLSLTPTGVLMGTPHYIAPELCEGGDAGPAADVYALGLTLWFLLVGDHPFNGTGIVEILEQQIRKPLPDVRERNRAVPEALWRIMLKASEKDPGQRHRSAAELADALEAFLSAPAALPEARPVNDPPSAPTVVVRGRRRRGIPWWAWAASGGAVAGGATVVWLLNGTPSETALAAIVTAAGASFWLQSTGRARPRAGRTPAVTAKVERMRNKRRERAAKSDGRPAVSAGISRSLPQSSSQASSQAVSQSMVRSLPLPAAPAPRVVRPEPLVVPASRPLPTGPADRLAGTASGARRPVNGTAGSEPARAEPSPAELEIECRLQAARTAGDLPAAESAARELIALRERTWGPDHARTAEALTRWAGLLRAAGKPAEAESALRRAAAARENSAGPDHPDTADALRDLAELREAAGDYADAAGLLKRALDIRLRAMGADHPAVAQAMYRLARLFDAQGRPDDAEPLHRRAREIWSHTPPAESARLAADELRDMARSHLRFGEVSRALPLLARSAEFREKRDGGAAPELAEALTELGLLHKAAGRAAEAEGPLTRAAEIWERVRGSEHPDTAAALNHVAEVHRLLRRPEAAEPLYRRALAIWERVRGPEHPDTAVGLNNLGLLLAGQRDFAGAEPLLTRALQIRRSLLGPTHPDTAQSLNNLAGMYLVAERFDAAEPLFRQALSVWEESLGPGHPLVSSTLNNLAALLAKTGRSGEAAALEARSLHIRAAARRDSEGPEAAEPAYRAALEAWSRAEGSTRSADRADLARFVGEYAALLDELGLRAEAEPLHRRAAEAWESALGAEHAVTAAALYAWGQALLSLGRTAEADPPLARALDIRTRVLTADDPDIARSLNALGLVRRRQGRPVEAEPLYRRALEIWAARPESAPHEMGLTLNNLAEVCRQTGRPGEAEPLYRRSLAVQEDALGPDHPETAVVVINLALLLGSMGRDGEAEPLYRRALAVWERVLGADHPTYLAALDSFGGLLRRMGRSAEAEQISARIAAAGARGR